VRRPERFQNPACAARDPLGNSHGRESTYPWAR
jgi:hypothetical protein